MATSPCVWIVILSACWYTDFVHSLPVESIIDCTIGSTLDLGIVDEGYTGDIENVRDILDGTMLELEYPLCPQCEQFLKFNVSSTTNATVKTKTSLDAEALIETGGVLAYSITCTSTMVTNGRTVVVRDLNDNAPVFDQVEYIANITGILSEGEAVVQVKAVDADVSPINNHITYSLVATEHSPKFDVEPSSGQVVSVADQIESVTLQVMATDPQRLNVTTTVKVVIWESSDVVVISLNQEIGTVQNKTLEMKEALEKALGWSVKIISVSSSRGRSTLSRTIEIQTLQEKATPRTYVSFIATETNGTNVIPKETLQKKLLDDEEKVLEEFREVFGPDVQFRVEIAGSDTNNSIILGAIIGVALVSLLGGAAFFVHKRRRTQSKIQGSGNVKPDFASDNKSGDVNPDFALDNKSADVNPDFASDSKSADVNPDFASDNKSGDVNPDFASDNKSADVNPDFASDNKSGDVNPDFASDNKSADVNPDFAWDNKSGDVNPDFAWDNKSADVNPDFASDNKSADVNPDFAWDNKSGDVNPDFAWDNKSADVNPDFASDSKSADVNPDFASDSKSADVNPDFASDSKSADVNPDFASDSKSADVNPDFASDSKSADVNPDFASDNKSADVNPDFASDNTP